MTKHNNILPLSNMTSKILQQVDNEYKNNCCVYISQDGMIEFFKILYPL